MFLGGGRIRHAKSAPPPKTLIFSAKSAPPKTLIFRGGGFQNAISAQENPEENLSFRGARIHFFAAARPLGNGVPRKVGCLAASGKYAVFLEEYSILCEHDLYFFLFLHSFFIFLFSLIIPEETKMVFAFFAPPPC